MIRFAIAAIAALFASGAAAQDKVTFLTSWYAQAEHGGFYQALATGLYKKHGLDVTIRMGGPQVNGMQLMMAGQADMHMGYDFQVLKSLESGLTPVTVATSFQHDLQGLMTHEDVKSLAQLKGKTILVATAGRSSWWPWMKQKYGYGEEQVRPYTFNLQPFFADKNTAQQAYLSSEPLQAQKAGVKANFFLFARDGFPPYGTTIVATQRMVKEKPAVVQRFVRASMEGWKSYMADPAPANALSEAERREVLTLLRSEQFCDLAPAQVWARLLDDGRYLCSISTMYRLLAVAGENRGEVHHFAQIADAWMIEQLCHASRIDLGAGRFESRRGHARGGTETDFERRLRGARQHVLDAVHA